MKRVVAIHPMSTLATKNRPARREAATAVAAHSEYGTVRTGLQPNRLNVVGACKTLKYPLGCWRVFMKGVSIYLLLNFK